ncbi:MAG TPA: hypothetical protein EYQ83_04810 [Acidobacteria bacterium]|nr:hypothetical protein [Acidobacteriota bacterium]
MGTDDLLAVAYAVVLAADRHTLVMTGATDKGWLKKARRAVAGLLLLRFAGPPTEPAVRLSPQRALHGSSAEPHTAGDGVHGVGMR